MTAAWPGYFADPFVVALPGGGYLATGSGPPAGQSAAGPAVFECLTSADLRLWQSSGPLLRRLPAEAGDEYWAPELAHRDGAWWMYYSVGHGIDGHHLRVARSEAATGPYLDLGANLTPGERFAIDAHPFRDDDGTWYLFFARDILDGPRPGTHLAVAPLPAPDRLGPITPVLQPDADWQLYQRSRRMYGRIIDWHTLEGPFVVRRNGSYWMTFSGGAWTGRDYAVSWARAPHPLGPWAAAPADAPPLLATAGDLIGPGHNSIVTGSRGDVIAFHAWNPERTRRQLHLADLQWTALGPRIGPPERDSADVGR